MTGRSVLLGAVGDVFINRESRAAPFGPSLAALKTAGMLLGNSEGVYCERPQRAITSGIPVVAAPGQADALTAVGFDVMSLANNHTMDAGADGLNQTLAVLQALDIHTIGAGRNIEEAQRAACIDKEGVRVSFLAWSSVFRPGYAAKANAPGIAVMRAHTHFYYPDWHPTGLLEPGTPPHVRTFPYPEDVETLTRSVRCELENADHVVASFHWGQTGPSVLHDYERTLAHAAIDSGASLVLGHHPHFLRGAEIYRGRPILYGLSHFAFDLGGLDATLGPEAIAMRTRLDPYGIFPREGYPLLPFHADARMTVIAYCRLDKISHDTASVDSGSTAFLLPCIINPENQPVPVDAASPDGQRVAQYLARISQEQGLSTSYSADGPLVAGLRTLSIHGS